MNQQKQAGSTVGLLDMRRSCVSDFFESPCLSQGVDGEGPASRAEQSRTEQVQLYAGMFERVLEYRSLMSDL